MSEPLVLDDDLRARLQAAMPDPEPGIADAWIRYAGRQMLASGDPSYQAWLRIAANPYHDERGRFTFKAGAAAGGANRAGMGDVALSEGEVAAMRNGSAEAHLIRNADGSYRFSEERQALHDDIIRRRLDGKAAAPNPTFTVMGGGPASGKSHLIDDPELGRGLRDDGDTLLVNSDEMKAELPEYTRMVADKNPTAAAFCHEESTYIAKRLQTAGFQRRTNVTLDGTGDSSPEKLRGKITSARAHGYRVEGSYVNVPVETALERSAARAARTGRYVPESYLRQSHRVVSSTAAATYQEFDRWSLFETTSGVEPVMSWDGRSTTVHNAGAWDSFLAKAGPHVEPPRAGAGISFSGRGGR